MLGQVLIFRARSISVVLASIMASFSFALLSLGRLNKIQAVLAYGLEEAKFGIVSSNGRDTGHFLRQLVEFFIS